MIYQCILAFHDDNMIIMKPEIYYNKNDIVILYINIETRALMRGEKPPRARGARQNARCEILAHCADDNILQELYETSIS